MLRFFVCSLLVVLVGCHKPVVPPPVRDQRPNVLLVTMDTTRVDHLGCYDYKLAHTANIDRLAGEGVRALDHATTAPITMPAHTSIMTGLLPPAHGVRDNGTYALADDAKPLAEILQAHGYETHAFVSAVVLDRRYNLTQGFDTYDDDLEAENQPQLFMIRDRPAPRTTAQVLKWLDQWGPSRAKPFFTWIHYFDPHQPYHPHTNAAALVPTPYDAEIASVDESLGNVLEKLRALGVLDNTIVVLTADHGEGLSEHGEKTHAFFVYDTTIHVPLIMRYPSKLPAGVVYSGPTRHIDIAPTILGLLGLKGGESMQGMSLVASLRGEAPPPELPQYCESMVAEVGFGMAPLVGVRFSGHKYVRVPKPELYDLVRDPHELTNLYDAKPEIVAKLSAKLDELIADSKTHALTPPAENPMTGESLETLMALGYVARPEERAAMNGMDPKDGLPIYEKLESARHAAQHNDWDRAITELDSVLATNPRNVSARDVLGLAYFRKGDLENAQRAYEASLAVEPMQVRAVMMLGHVALAQNDLPRAQQLFARARTITPHSGDVIAMQGYVAQRLGDTATTEVFFTDGAKEDPFFVENFRHLGDLSSGREAYAEAVGFYDRLLKVQSSNWGALLQGGIAAAYAGDPAKAALYLQMARDLRPDSWLPIFNQAWLRVRDGDAQDALDLLGETLPLGFAMQHVVENEVDWAPVRKLPGYEAWLFAVRENSENKPQAKRARRSVNQ